ncbi:hypothetical protein BLOT_008827 [Blomia tropicalis]|nr:hypothetical protein BLOT_008827 [Blomia tropicalis]
MKTNINEWQQLSIVLTLREEFCVIFMRSKKLFDTSQHIVQKCCLHYNDFLYIQYLALNLTTFNNST